MAADDFIMTIDSDDEALPEPRKPSNAKGTIVEDAQLNPDFVFDLSGDPYVDLLGDASGPQDYIKKGSKPVRLLFTAVSYLLKLLNQEPISVDDIIERRKLKKVIGKRKRESDDGSHEESQSEDESEDNSVEGDESVGGSDEEFGGLEANEDEEDPLASSGEEDDDELEKAREDDDGVESDEGRTSEDSDEEETQAEKDRKTAFFAPDAEPSEEHSSFVTMNLSRPILKAITALNFTKPTPIQAATIPVALLGKDIVGNAVTGSGKTAAFIVPMLERLLYRDRGKNAAATRCLILVPTRELGVQCYEVGTKLATHTDVRFCLVVGMLSFRRTV